MQGVLDGYEVPDAYAVPLGIDMETGKRVSLDVRKFTQHGFIGGATGVGKTRTLQQIIEWCSQRGIPNLAVDGKGDMGGLAIAADATPEILDRVQDLGQDEWWDGTSTPVEFLALGGNGAGVPVKVSAKTFPYKMLARVIGLTKPQTTGLGYAYLASKNATSGDMHTLEQLREFVRGIKDDPDSSLSEAVANRIIAQSQLFEESNPGIFGAPEFDPMDIIRKDDGWGQVSIIDSAALADNPEVMTTFLLWFMDKLSKVLPQTTQVLPKLMVFIDEAHALFDQPSPELKKEFVREFTGMIKKLRSQGVGIFLISQSADDIPEKVMQQIGSRVQHALRANTVREARAVKRTAETFPMSKTYDVASEITEMGTGEAIVSVLNDDGRMTPTAVVRMYVPRSSMDPLDPGVQAEIIHASELRKKYARLAKEQREAEHRASVPAAPIVATRPSKGPQGDDDDDSPVERMRKRLRSGSGVVTLDEWAASTTE